MLRKRVVVCSSIVLLFVITVTATAAVSQQEYDALVAFYNATGGPNWTNHTNWSGPLGTECTWYGVTCDGLGSAVVQLQLPENNLKGQIPAAVSGLAKLTYLNLQGNQLSGAIPPSIGSMTALAGLDLRTNSLTGPIPSEIGNLANLRDLLLNRNQLSGAIPPEIGNLKSLQGGLYLGFNKLTGSIPASIGQLGSLLYLYLNSNQLSGQIPPEIGNLNSLKELDLESNNLTGSIPSSIGQLRSLVLLYLNDNNLSGQIPAEIGNLTSLQGFWLGSNNLSGPIPASIGQLGSLVYLWAAYNHLSGQIPPEIGNLTNLKELELFSNNFSGTIPKELGNLTNLTLVQLDGENSTIGGLTGSIPPELGKLTNLQAFSAAVQQLSGLFPTTTVMQWRNLDFIALEGNHFTGPIPGELAQLPKLTEIDLAINDFDPGPIPSEYLTMTNLTYLSLGETNRTGSIPGSIGNLTSLQFLRLWGNQLTGTIPAELGSMTALHNLWISANNLRGPIPDSLMNLHLDLDSGPRIFKFPSIFSYNALYTTNPALRDFLNSKVQSGNWEENTQTVPPTKVTVVSSTPTSITLSWQPIAYTADPGGYEINVSTTPGGPYTRKLITTDKSIASATVSGLTPSTHYYVVLKSVTYPHAVSVNRVYPRFARNTQTNTIVSDPTPEVSATTAAPAPAPANVVVSQFPSALVQVENAEGATATYSLTNNGGTATSVTLTRDADFFTQSPTTFSLNPGQTQIVTVSGVAKPAGVYDGSSIVSGTGVPAGLVVRIHLLVSAPPPATVSAVAGSNRVDVSAPAEQNPTVDVSFTNTGTAPLSGILVSDARWAIPPAGIITIQPGETTTVTITIDRSKRSEAEGESGSVAATLSLVYFNGSQPSGKRGVPSDTTPAPGVSVTIVTVVDTTAPPVTTGAIPPLAAGEVALFIPGVGDLQGSVGRFISDIGIVNGSGAVTLNGIKLYHFAIDGSAVKATGVTITKLAPSQSLVYGDVAKTVFKSEGRVGTIQLRSPDVASISVVANIFNVSSPAGTFGTTIPVFRSDRAIAAGQNLYISGVVHEPGLTHTNLYIQETAGAQANVSIAWYDASGAALGTSTASVAPFALTPINNVAPVGARLAVVTNAQDSAGKVLAYATPVDERSGDTWDVVDWSRQEAYDYTEEVIVPVAGAAPGANNTYFRTDLSITNIGTQDAAGTLIYYPIGGSLRQQAVSLGALQTLTATDVVTTLLKSPAGVGYLTFKPQAGNSFAVTSRTYTTTMGQPATFGTAVPTLARSSGLRAGQSRKIGNLDDASLATIKKGTPATFRTNMGLVETLGKPVQLRASLLYNDPSGQLASAKIYGSKTYDLGPNESILIGGMARWIMGDARDTNLGDMKNVQLTVEVIGGDGALLFYATSVDNGTGDNTLRTQ